MTVHGIIRYPAYFCFMDLISLMLYSYVLICCCGGVFFPSGPPRFEGGSRFGDRDGYRGGPRGPPGEFGGDKGGAPPDFQPSYRVI